MWGEFLGGMGLQFLMGERTNSSNRRQARDATSASVFEAEKAREWEQWMSNTAHTREIHDLKTAGLNPLLSGTGGGGASTPSSPVGSPSMAQDKNSLDGLLTSALEAKALKMAGIKQQQDIELTKAQKEKTKMETRVMSKGIPEADVKNQIWDFLKPMINKAKDSLRTTPKKKGYTNEEAKQFINELR